MVKRIKIILLGLVIFSFNKSVFAISDNFKFVIDTIGIPRYNVYGQEINEDVYYTYNVFCYGSPKEASQNAEQGFKYVQNGLWTLENVKYTGIGTPGEYYYVGRSYSGSLVSNVRYPVSFFPETIPNYWNYVETDGALKSWNDSSKYKYKEQLDYMKNVSILYDKLDFERKVTDPYNLIEYGISADMIGLNKVTLDACSTWKTAGVLTAVRRESTGAIRYAIFATAPMAASAKVKSDLTCNSQYIISEDEKQKNILINFGAHVENLNNYAKASHIKEMKAYLYINGNLVTTVSSSKSSSVSKDYILNINRDDASSYPLYIEVKSTLYTEFATDGLMQDSLSKVVNVNIFEYKNKISNPKIKYLSKIDDKYYVSDLIKTSETDAVSYGIIQAGNHICIKFSTQCAQENINIYINDEKQNYSVIKNNGEDIYLDLEVKDKYITINSWNFLRNKTKNYFTVNQNDVGKRITEPNRLKIEVEGKEEILKFDAIDNYNLNMNYNLDNVKNSKDAKEKIEIDSW